MGQLYRRIWVGITVVVMLLMVSASSIGQTSPFDLKYKLNEEDRTDFPKESKSEIVPSSEDVTVEKSETSPDEDLPITTDVDKTSRATSDSDSTDESGLDNEPASDDTMTLTTGVDNLTEAVVDPSPIPSDDNRSIFLFLMLIAATILTTLTIASNKSLVNNILRAVLNDNYLNLMYREHKKSGVSHYYILYFVFAVNAGLFLYFVLTDLVLNEGLPMLWRCVMLIGIIYVIRHLFMSYLAHVYPFQKELEQYAFTILIFNIFLGLVLLPINVFIAFSPEPIESIFLYGGAVIVSIVYIFRQLRGIFIGSRLLINNKFYFLLYLCAVEIAPVILLVKYAGAYVS